MYNKAVKEKSTDINKFYLDDYEIVMSNGAIGWFWRRIHSALDYPFLNKEKITIIEVGSGNGQHFNLTSVDAKEYIEVDLRKSKNFNIKDKKVKELGRKFVVDDATQLVKFSNSSFDGLIATCLLAHLVDVEQALLNWRRVVRPGGMLSIYLPNEPGLLLRFAREFSTKRKIKSRGYDHDYIHWKEHRNHFLGMKAMIKHVFRGDSIKFRNFPFSFLTWNFGLYTLVQIRKDV